MHRLDALHGRRRVLVRLQQPLARAVFPNLEVRQIYVDQTMQQLQTLERVERRCVVYDGQAQAELARVENGENDLRNDVLGGD